MWLSSEHGHFDLVLGRFLGFPEFAQSSFGVTVCNWSGGKCTSSRNHTQIPPTGYSEPRWAILSLSLSHTHTHTYTHTHSLSRQECGILIYLGNLVKSTSQPVFSSGHSFIIISSFSIVSYPLYLPTLEVSSSLRNELLLVRPITEFYYIHTHMSYRFYISGESWQIQRP